jgi:hypothetical protein
MNTTDKKIVKDVLNNGVTNDNLVRKKVKEIHINKLIEIITDLKLKDKILKKI